jgi:hypothetical protein
VTDCRKQTSPSPNYHHRFLAASASKTAGTQQLEGLDQALVTRGTVGALTTTGCNPPIIQTA